MKKIVIFSLIIMSFLLLVACKKKKPDAPYQDYNEIKKELVEQKESFQKQVDEIQAKIDKLEDQTSEEVIKLKEELENLQAMLEKFDDIGGIGNEIDRLDKQLEIILVELEKLEKENEELRDNYLELLKMVVYLNLSFHEVDDTYGLSQRMTYDFSSLNSLNVVEIEYNLTNKFTSENSEYDPVIINEKTALNKLDTVLDVPYHGIFIMNFILTYSFSGETMSELFEFNLSFKTDTYNLTWLHASMPVLLLASDLLSNEIQGITYVEIERAKTYDFDKLPSNAIKYPVAVSSSKGNYNQNQIPNFRENVTHDNKNLMIKWIEELYQMDNKSNFIIYGVDNILNVVNSALLSKVPIDNLTFKIYTDGSFTAGMINSNYKNINDFNSLNSAANKKVTDLSKGKVNNLEPKHILALTDTNRFQYIVNNMEDWSIHSALPSSLNVRSLTVSEAFDAVEANDNLDELEYLLRTKWGEAADESMSFYFNHHNKKNLLILGTSTNGESNVNFASFDNYINYLNIQYQNDYKMFYKGHPQFPSNQARKDLFEEKEITELPNSIPVETLMLLYPNVYIGGYAGTSFQSSLEDQTVFFFGTKALVSNNAILANLINTTTIFNNTVYLTVDSEGNIVLD